MTILQFAMPLKKFDQFIGNKFEAFHFLMISFFFFLDSSSRKGLKLCKYIFQGHVQMRQNPFILSAHYLIKQLLSYLAPMFERNFSNFNPHLEGTRIELSSNQHDIASFGSDDIIFRVDNLMGQTNTLELKNQERLEITSFVIHPKIANTFIFGTSSGLVKILRPIHHLQLHKGDILFKGGNAINHLAFSNQGRYLFISSSESSAVILCTKSRKLYTLPNQHEGIVITGSFCNESMVFSIGSEGKIHLYSIKGQQEHEEDQDISDDPFAQITQQIQFTLIDSYKIASETISKKYSYLNACYSQWQQREKQTKVILMSGQTFLQMVVLNNEESSYQIQKRISEEKEILHIYPLGRGQNSKGITLVTATESILSIWNYTKMQKIIFIDIYSQLKAAITNIKTFQWKGMPSFAFVVNHVESNGKLYLFANHELLNVDDKQPQINEQQIQEKKDNEEGRSDSQRRFLSIKDKLVPLYPQFALDKAYQEYQKAKFLFYNSVGCVIERTDSDSSTLQLELHDKSKPRKFKINVKNRSFGMFALKQKAFLCSTTNVLMFQEEKQLKDNAQGWQVIWENIQDVALGGSWVAAINNEEIRIFDYSGNELHCLCFDRRFVTMEAYQDLLVVVYHASLPMWGCQSLKMRIYKVSTLEATVDRDVIVPIKPNSILKWFGFSEEGMIFCQDSLEIVRGYSFQQDLWQTVLSLQGKSQRLFVQHIQGSDIFGFRIESREDQKEEPKVLPRSLPRKTPMEWSEISIEFLQKQQINYLKKIMLKNLLIEQEEFRHKSWYKLKYSRKKDHVWFQQSKTIKSSEEIKTLKMMNDIQLHDYLKKYLARSDIPRQKISKVSMSLILICQRETHFQETREKVRKMLTNIDNTSVYLPKEFEEMSFKPVVQPIKCKEKLYEINILEQILNLMNYS